MNYLHQKLTTKYRLYHNWHQHKHHNKVHWGVFVVFGLVMLSLILNSQQAKAIHTPPSGLTATAISSSLIDLSWTASADGVTGYKIFRCQTTGCAPTTQIATSPTNSYSDTGLAAGTAYTYAVSAYDAAGNNSAQSTNASATTQTASQTGKTLYVSPTGNDAITYAQNGINNPWATIGRAAWGSANRSSPNSSQAAQAGDTVIVRAGTYPTAGTGLRYDPAYNPVNTGMSGSPITFQAEGIVVLTQTGEGPLIGANTRNYITWKGFTIYEINALASSDTGPAVLWSTIGSRIEDSVIDGWDNGRLGNNHNGIRLEGAQNSVVKNNKIYNVLNFGTRQQNGAGIMVYGSQNIIIENNEIYNSGSGIFIKGRNNENFTVRYNYIYDTDQGILLGVTGGINQVYQNIVRSNETTGISLRPLIDSALTGTFYIVNNTVIGPNLNNGGIWFAWRTNSTGNFIVQNNILYHTGNQTGIDAFYWDDASYLSFDYNDYYNVNRWQLNSSNYASLANWRTVLGGCPGTGNDCGSTTNNPFFVDPDQINYRLQPGSPNINAGIDILDLNRNSSTIDPINIGAYVTGNECIGLLSNCVVVSDAIAPSTPTNLTATPISTSQINLSWTASTDPPNGGQATGVTGYRVERCQGSTCANFSQIATPTGTSYGDTGLAANTTYRYRVRAVDGAGNLSGYSNIVSGVTQTLSVASSPEPKCPGGSSPDTNVLFCDDFENWNINNWIVGAVPPNTVGNFVRSDKKIYGNYGAWTGQCVFDRYWGCFGYDTELNAFPEQSEMYIRWYTTISPNYVFGNAEDKLFILHDQARTIGPYIFASRPGGGEHGNYGTGKPGASIYQDCDWGETSPCDGSEWVNRGQNTGNDITLQPGRTYLFEWYIKLNTPGARNGTMKLFVDDATNGDPQTQTLRMNWTNVRYLRTGDAGKKYGRLRLTVYSQQKYATEPAERYMTWDNIVVSKLPIGPMGGTVADTISPTIPTNLQDTPISSSQINLSWTASTDPPNGGQATGVTGYRVERCQGSSCTNFIQVATPTTTSYSDTGLSPNTTYRYRVRAVDGAGNLSDYSSIVNATTSPQTFKPSDLNQDTKVDQLDFDILKQDWNKTTKPKSDINQDGIVDSRDLGIMMSNWSR